MSLTVLRTALCFAATLLLAAAPPLDPGKAGMDPARLERLAQRMKAYAEQGVVAGTVTLVARRGAVAGYDASGWQDIEARKPMRPDSIFQVMSMTKPVTAVAIQLLVEEGKVRIGDPVEKYLPEFRGQWVVEAKTPLTMNLRKPARAITVRDLLTHTSCMTGPGPALSDLYTKMNRTLSEAVGL
ncbi:MAG TPA: serine hydrolase, partial [Solibacterales bacterium]|nr:serine hydrolase [Bryobacterales bacterium]